MRLAPRSSSMWQHFSCALLGSVRDALIVARLAATCTFRISLGRARALAATSMSWKWCFGTWAVRAIAFCGSLHRSVLGALALILLAV